VTSRSAVSSSLFQRTWSALRENAALNVAPKV